MTFSNHHHQVRHIHMALKGEEFQIYGGKRATSETRSCSISKIVSVLLLSDLELHPIPSVADIKYFCRLSRCSRRSGSMRKGVLRNFTKILRKTPVPETLFFNKMAGLRHRCFPVNFAKFLRTFL